MSKTCEFNDFSCQTYNQSFISSKLYSLYDKWQYDIYDFTSYRDKCIALNIIGGLPYCIVLIDLLIQIINIYHQVDDDILRISEHAEAARLRLIIQSRLPICIKSLKCEKWDDKCENKECSICLMEYEIDNILSILPCKHVFHSSGIVKWNKNSCPLCRFKIN